MTTTKTLPRVPTYDRFAPIIADGPDGNLRYWERCLRLVATVEAHPEHYRVDDLHRAWANERAAHRALRMVERRRG